MNEIRMGMAESRFADIIWQHEPMTTKDLVAACSEVLQWKRTTTYTVLKRLCERGIFQMQDSVITSLISKDEFYALQSQRFVDDVFNGSLPAFLAAFTAHKKLSEQEVAEILRQIDRIGKE